jgi:hypothetical protein
MFATAAMLTWPDSVSGDCFSRFMTLRAEPSNSIVGGTDNHGNPVNIRNATAMTYDLCLKTWGRDLEYWRLVGSVANVYAESQVRILEFSFCKPKSEFASIVNGFSLSSR